MPNAQIHLDTSALQPQVDEFLRLAKVLPDATRDHLIELLKCCGANIRLGQHVGTPGADGSVHISIPVLLGADFECLLAALRTGEADGF